VGIVESSATTRRNKRPLLPAFRLSRLYLTSQLLGMYFVGYGDFLSTIETLGRAANRHFAIRGSYQLAQRFNINNRFNRIGLNLTRKGPAAGFEFSF